MKKRLLFVVLVFLSARVSTARDSKPADDLVRVDSSNATKLNSITPTIWPTFDGYQQTGKVNAAFNCNGTFGINYSLQPLSWNGPGPAPSFVTPPDSNIEYLYGGAIWIGGILDDDTLVSVGHDGWQQIAEFFPPNYGGTNPQGTVNEVHHVADYSLRCEFSDTVDYSTGTDPFDGFHRPLNIKVANRSHSWHSTPANNCIIYDMVITNVGDETIHDGFVGLYFDCDIGTDPQSAYLDDLTGSFEPEGIAYIIDNDGDVDGLSLPATRIFAFKFLENTFKATNPNYNWWIGNGNPGLDFGPRQKGTPENPFRDFGTGGIGTPEGDANKYYIMSFKEWDYDQIFTYSIGDSDPVWLEPIPSLAGIFSSGYDTRFLMSIGPFTLDPDSSARVLYTTFTGDFVHSGGGTNYLPEDPYTFLSLLYFGHTLQNATVADSLAQILLDPYLPPLGLQVVSKSDSAVLLEWDAWSLDDVNFYELFVSEINYDSLPYPGAIPPWLGVEEATLPIEIPRTHFYTLSNLDPDKHYAASIAHRVGLDIGELSDPIQIKVAQPEQAPQIRSRFAFANPGTPLKLDWQVEDKQNIDHFNIYKFPDLVSALSAYHAFYDNGGYTQFIEPKDSFEVENVQYYFYAMTPYAVMNANDSVFYDSNATEGEVYLIASADQYGFESNFTVPIIANDVSEMNRSVLLITNSPTVTSLNFTYEDSIFSFYERILDGIDYEIYNNRDSMSGALCPSQAVDCMDWHDFMSFELVIIDDRLSERFFSSEYEKETNGFERYLSYGGKLAYFGNFSGYLPSSQFGYPTNVSPGEEFTYTHLGIDSLMFGGVRYYFISGSPPYTDSLFGFYAAINSDGSLPDVKVDFNRDPFRSRLRNFWTAPTPPGVATFKLSDHAFPVQSFSSTYPEFSIQQGDIVAARRDFPKLNTSAYVFGYHLWYMDTLDARNLVETLLGIAPSVMSAQTNISPNIFSVVQSNSIEPQFATVYLGNLAPGHNVNEIETGSLIINDSIVPASISTLPDFSGYAGEVLQLDIPLRPFLLSYSPVWDTLHTSYRVSGFLSGEIPFEATGAVSIIGHRRGDFNNDNSTDILDLNLLVSYLFRSQSLPENAIRGDIVRDNDINILDLTQLVNYLLRNQTMG